MRILKKAGAVFAVILMLSTSSVFAQLVTNGSFESSNIGVITGTDVKGWLVQTSASITPAPVFEIVGDTVQQGNRALKVTVNATGTNQWDIQIVADSIPAKPGESYIFTIWAKSQTAGAQVNFTIGNYDYAEYKAIRPATLTKKWTKYTTTFKVNDQSKSIRVPIHFSYSANIANAIYIDNLSVVSANASKEPVIVQAESGVRGSNFSVLKDGTTEYVTAKTTYTGLTSPGDSSRVITYQVTFPDTGTYNLFAHLRTGSGGFDDDSFFYGKGFGVKNDTASADWVFINGLASAGFSDTSSIVDGPGSLGNSVWKWVNISKNSYQSSSATTFHVGANELTKIFKIGSREDGLNIDKFAFGRADLLFTVKNLNNGEAASGSTTPIDSTLIWKGPALATGQAKFLGNVPSDNPESTFVKYWNQLTPGNAGKWESVGVSTDTTKWNWTGLTAQYNYAKTNNLIFKDHCLIWGAQQPSWISTLDSTQQIKYIETWIRQVGQKFPNMDFIDVVNEPLTGHNPPDGTNGRAKYKNALGGNGSTGWDWVINAFKLARKYLPNTKLLLNDFGIINDNSATNTYLQIINLLKDRNLIDGIGVQGHRFELETADTTVLKYNLNKLAATGLPIYISELDLGNVGDIGTADDNQQLNLYKKYFPILWKHSGVKGITLWGYMEDQMWKVTCFLVNADGTSRPALVWLAQYLKDNPTDVNSIANSVPNSFELMQNFPNPFNPTTTIRFSLTQTSQVKLEVFNMLGQRVDVLINNQNMSAGSYEYKFNAAKLASGVYIYHLVAGNYSSAKKMIVLK